MDGFIVDLIFILATATVFSVIARSLKQPFIPAYVIAGILIGPFGLKLITDINIITAFAEFGVALLLFVIGLELNLKKLKVVGKVSAIGGLIEILLIAGVGFVVAVLFGFRNIEALYVGLILAFSSTAVVLKVLSDKNEINTLHGRIMLGILLIQDIFVIFALSFLMSLNNFGWESLLSSTINGVGIIALAFILARYILPLFFRKIAESEELLLLFALTWCFAFVGLAGLVSIPLSIGAFIAGISLASFPYNVEIIAKIKPIRDLFVTIFFVSIGMQIVPIVSANKIWFLLALIGIAVILKPIIIMILSSLFGFSRRTAFLSGLGLMQISEFSIILASQGVIFGHISRNLLSIVIITAVITMTLTSYIIKYDYKIYKALNKGLFFLKKNRVKNKLESEIKLENHYVLCGSDKTGRVVLETLKKLGKKFIVVDYDPEIIRKLMRENVPCIYGDISDDEVLEKINVRNARAIISTIPNQNDNMFLLKYLMLKKSKVNVFLTAKTISDAMELYDLGATYVILPKVLSGDKLSDIIKHFMEKRVLDALRLKQITKLTDLKEEELLEKFAPSLIKYKDKLKLFRKKK